MEKLFEKYVPKVGKASTVGGEIVRAYNRIAYRYYNDGDVIGEDYGNETCNAPARYLQKVVMETRPIINKMWGGCLDYEGMLKMLEETLLTFLTSNDNLFQLENKEDMWDYQLEEDCEYEDFEEDDDDIVW